MGQRLGFSRHQESVEDSAVSDGFDWSKMLESASPSFRKAWEEGLAKCSALEIDWMVFFGENFRGSRHDLYETHVLLGGIMGKSELNGLNGYNWYFDNL